MIIKWDSILTLKIVLRIFHNINSTNYEINIFNVKKYKNKVTNITFYTINSIPIFYFLRNITFQNNSYTKF